MSAGYYRVGSYYVDTTNPSAPVFYRCMTVGTKSTSVWAQVSGGGGGSVQQYKVIANADQGDYILCNTWDGSNLGITNIPIVKPYKLRDSITSETIAGVAHSYTYSTDSYGRKIRTNSWAGGSETELITPDYLSGDIIYAIACAQTIGSGIPLAVASVTLVNPGTGGTYAINNILTLAGGSGTQATIKVLTVSSGQIVTYELLTAGSYSSAPTLTNNAVTGGGGTGATFDVAMQSQLLDINADGRAWAT